MICMPMGRPSAVCPIGAGDALTAAYVWAMTRKSNAADALMPDHDPG